MGQREAIVSIRFAESMRSVFYTPVYVTVNLGFCSQEGLKVDVYTCSPGENSAGLVAHGLADVAQSSPSAGLMAVDKGERDVPLHFAQINHRDGFFIVGKPGRTSFRWTDLEGAHLLVAAFAAQPWLSLQYCLRKQNVDSERIKLTRYANLHEEEQAFRRGEGDFVHLPQPYAEKLLVEGLGRLAAAVGPVIGNVAFSSLTAARDRVLRQDPVLVSFTRAFTRALKWVHTAAPRKLGEAIQTFFTDTDKDVLVRSAERYKNQGTWTPEPLLSEGEFQVIQDIFFAGRSIKRRYPFGEIVNTIIARRVMEEESLKARKN